MATFNFAAPSPEKQPEGGVDADRAPSRCSARRASKELHLTSLLEEDAPPPDRRVRPSPDGVLDSVIQPQGNRRVPLLAIGGPSASWLEHLIGIRQSLERIPMTTSTCCENRTLELAREHLGRYRVNFPSA